MAKYCYPGDSVRVRGWRGIAFHFLAFATIDIQRQHDDADGYWMEADREEDQSRAVVVMIGDDKRHIVDIDDLSPLSREAYCGVCGQIGCHCDK